MTDRSFTDERERLVAEFEAYYGADPLDTSAWESALHAACDRHPRWSSYRCKAMGYTYLTRTCPVHVFRHSPFYFEFNTGRPRTDLGTGGVGGWLKRTPANTALRTSSEAWLHVAGEQGLSSGWAVLDDNHHTVGYEKILRLGLGGLRREAEASRATAATREEKDFLNASIAGLNAMMRIARRFAREAGRLLSEEQDPVIRRRLRRIAMTARRVPAEPAQTFFEALNTILFIFYVMQSIEGNGISVFGHVDRILIPYYRRDIESGRLTEAEARSLIGHFLAISDTRYGMMHAPTWNVGTNGTITLGGCDRDGMPVFNALTRLLIETHRDLKLIDPKINARISRNHPPAYYELLAACAVGGNSLAIFNDDVVISSNQRMGKALEDCRLYVGGGCQENVIEECEVNSRATIYLNLLAVFRLGFFPDSLASFCRANGIQPRPYESCQSYDALHDVFLANLKDVVDAHIRERNRTEGEGWRYNPCPLHSATLGDCLARRRDMMAGGCRYNFGSVSLTGIGTLVDSLFAVKAVCFDAPKVSYADLRRMLETDFKGEDAFRAYLLNRVPKFGQAGDPDLRAFSARVFADVARVTAGMPNTRGGRYEASLFSFRSFTHFGQSTGATPDGRRAGEHLSSGMSPSMQALGSEADLGRLLTALEPLDMTRYPVVAVLDVKLPALSGGMRPAFIVPVLRRFLEAGGSVLQTNCVDQAVLEDARRHPDRHPDLVVRVSGFSSVFVRLSESIQDEIIARTRATI